jgi:hypothetical protein
MQGKYIKTYSTMLKAAEEISGKSTTIRFRKNQRKKIFFGQYVSKDPLTTEDICKVHRYDLTGNYIDSFYSEFYAEKLLGINSQNISRAIKIEGTYKGYQWRKFLTSKIPNKIIHSKETTRKLQGKPIQQIDIVTGKVLKTYNVTSDAQRAFGWSIFHCAQGKCKTAYGFKWKYA